MKEKYEDDIHNATPERLAQMIEELARHHVDKERETLYEAARRLRDRQRIPFNHEAFE